jgi:hypothetical protein
MSEKSSNMILPISVEPTFISRAKKKSEDTFSACLFLDGLSLPRKVLTSPKIDMFESKERKHFNFIEIHQK